MIDYPEDFLPESFPAADLILSFAEHKGVAELLPDIAEMTGMTRESVTRILDKWKNSGEITIQKNKFIRLNPAFMQKDLNIKF